MMTIMGKRFTNRGVSVVIASLLLIAIAVAAAVLLYVFSIGLMGSLGSSGGQQTKQQLILEAYDWIGNSTTVKLQLRNVGSAAIAIGTSDFFVNGVKATQIGCSGSLAVQDRCTATLTGFTAVTSGVAAVIKVVTPDGAVFSYSAISGQAS